MAYQIHSFCGVSHKDDFSFVGMDEFKDKLKEEREKEKEELLKAREELERTKAEADKYREELERMKAESSSQDAAISKTEEN